MGVAANKKWQTPKTSSSTLQSIKYCKGQTLFSFLIAPEKVFITATTKRKGGWDLFERSRTVSRIDASGLMEPRISPGK